MLFYPQKQDNCDNRMVDSSSKFDEYCADGPVYLHGQHDFMAVLANQVLAETGRRQARNTGCSSAWMICVRVFGWALGSGMLVDWSEAVSVYRLSEMALLSNVWSLSGRDR